MSGSMKCVGRKTRIKYNRKKSVTKQNPNKMGKRRKKNLKVPIGLALMNTTSIPDPAWSAIVCPNVIRLLVRQRKLVSLKNS